MRRIAEKEREDKESPPRSGKRKEEEREDKAEGTEENKEGITSSQIGTLKEGKSRGAVSWRRLC